MFKISSMKAFVAGAALAVLPLTTGCSNILVGIAGNALSGSNGSFFGAQEDPELVREALPFGLIAIEALVAAEPEDEDLLLAAASSFTQYAYAFVQQRAQMLEEKDPELSRRELARAKKLFKRARDYGMRAIEAEYDKEFRKKLESSDLKSAFEELDEKEAVPYLYWTAAPWAMLVTMSLDDLSVLGDLDKIEAMMRHAMTLEPDWEKGTLHEFFVSFESRGELIGGSTAKAREHYEKALELTGGTKMGPHVTWAESVAVPQQDRATFNSLIEHVLSFDLDTAPEYRLVNTIAQERAQWLKSRADDLFVEE